MYLYSLLIYLFKKEMLVYIHFKNEKLYNRLNSNFDMIHTMMMTAKHNYVIADSARHISSYVVNILTPYAVTFRI